MPAFRRGAPSLWGQSGLSRSCCWNNALPLNRSSRALLNVGDNYATQGDGEVCGTAIESPTMYMALTLDLMKGANLKTLSFTTPGPVTDHLDTKGYEVSVGICPDRMSRPRNAVSPMIDHLCATRGLSPMHAYRPVSAFISIGPCSNDRHVLDTLDNLPLLSGHPS
jgi:acetamidase/formamidase